MPDLPTWLRYACAAWLLSLSLATTLVVAGMPYNEQPRVHAFAVPLGLSGDKLHVTTRTNGRIKLWYHAPARARIRLVVDVILPAWPLITLTAVTAAAVGGVALRGRREMNIRRGVEIL